MSLGDAFNDKTSQGPQISQVQMDRILGYIEKGIQEGGKCEIGGRRHGTKGFFVEPTVFTGCKDDSVIVQAEIFGPVIPILKFETMEEVRKCERGRML